MTALEITMTTSEAKQVTERIKLLVGQIVDTSDKVVQLIEKAKAGEAWRVLGYGSWTAYVTAEFAGALEGLARAERVPIVAKLSETGMSTRAIATVVGAGKSTIDRDLDQVSHDGTPDLNISSETYTSGLDGKTYLRNGRPTAKGMTELANAVPPVQSRPRRSPLPDAYSRALHDLENVVSRLQRLHADDRFPANRAKLDHGSVHPFTDVVFLLNRLETDLEGGSVCRDCGNRIVPTFDNWREDCCAECRGDA